MSAQKKLHPLAANSKLSPKEISRILLAITRLQQITALDPMYEVADGICYPQETDNVFDYLIRVFERPSGASSIIGNPTLCELAIEQLRFLTQYNQMTDELIPVQQMLAKMLNLNYQASTLRSKCGWLHTQTCRPLQNTDARLLEAAFAEAAVQFWRIIDHNVVIEAINAIKKERRAISKISPESIEPHYRGLIQYARTQETEEDRAEKLLIEMLPLYKRLSICIQALNDIFWERFDSVCPGEAKSDADCAIELNRLFAALDKSYAKIYGNHLHPSWVPKEPNFEDILSPTNLRRLKKLGFNNIDTLQSDIKKELRISSYANIPCDAIPLSEALEALRAPILRMMLPYGEAVANRLALCSFYREEEK